MTECPNDPSNGYGSYNTTHPLPCAAPGCACAGARKDAERLEWLSANPGAVVQSNYYDIHTWEVGAVEFKDLREAIDAAIAAADGNK